jgi:hypothetical protein
MIPTNFYKLTDGILSDFTELQNIDVIYAVDKSDTSQDPQGSSKRLPIGLLTSYIIASLDAYVPLSGTDESDPITGPLILENGFYVGNKEESTIAPRAYTQYLDSSLYLFASEPGLGNIGIELHADPLALDPYVNVYSNISGFAGIEYQDDYAANFRANTLVTKQWVEDEISAIVIPDPTLGGVISVAMYPLNSQVLSPAVIGDVVIPYDSVITGWYMFGTDALGNPVNGSAQVDLYLDTYANWPPTVAETLFPTGKPSLTAQSKNLEAGLSTPLLEGYTLRVELTNVSLFGRLYLCLITENL